MIYKTIRKTVIGLARLQLQGPPQKPFFWKVLKKKLLNIFLNFFLYLKVQSFRLIKENNFIQIAASAGHAVAYMIGPIFKAIDGDFGEKIIFSD